MSERFPELPNTTYAVLGILSFGEALSGYEVRKWSESLRFFYWSPAQSQIYGELRRLKKLGYVTADYVVQEGKPNKRLYQINEAGLAAFRHWVNTQPLEPTVMKHSMVLRLFFGHAADPGRLVELLEQFIVETEEMLGQLSVVEEYTENHPLFAYPALVAEWGRSYHEAELAMARKLKGRLEGRGDDL